MPTWTQIQAQLRHPDNPGKFLIQFCPETKINVDYLSNYFIFRFSGVHGYTSRDNRLVKFTKPLAIENINSINF